MRIIVILLTWLVLSMGLTQAASAQQNNTREAQEDSATLPSMSDLQREAVDLKRNVLTATGDERADLAETADRVLARFDRRITALSEGIDERQNEMTSAAARYADELMSSLREQRSVVQRHLQRLGENPGDSSENAWDRAVFSFSSAYDSFVESWGDVEANFPLDP